MSSDEDQSFSFMCEGPSSVLGMFGESSGGLPGITPNAGGSELEDVYDKSSTNPVHLTSESDMSSSKEDEHSSERTSSFSKQESTLTVSKNEIEDLKESQHKTRKEKDLLCEGNDTINESGKVDDNSEQCTKDKEKLVPDKGSDELAAEILEVLGNSKCATNSENTISKLETCNENVINNSQSIQEELDSLEQLAMERVSEIENEIADSKESVNSKLYCDLPKEMPTVSVTVVNCHNIVSGECTNDASDQKEILNKPESGDKPIEVASTVSLSKCENFVSNENAESSKLVLKSNQEQAEDVTGVSHSSVSTHTSDASLNAVYNIGTNMNDSNLLSSCDVKECVDEPTNEKVKVVNDEGSDSVTLADENVKNEKITSVLPSADNVKNEKITSVLPSADNVKTCDLSDGVECSFQTAGIVCNLSDTERKLPEVNSGNKDCNVQFEDLKNYETDDDDLKVLEAFIVKSATNPEIAICPTKQIQDNDAKYSLESTLLDDLTKTDNETEPNLEVSEKKEELTSENNVNIPKDNETVNDEVCISHAQEEVLKEKSVMLDSNSLSECKTKTNEINRRQSKHKPVCCIGKRLPLKKRLSPRKIADFDDCGNVKNENNEIPAKIILSGLKRGRGRPFGSGKKPKLIQNTARVKSQGDKQFGNHCTQEESDVRECFVIIEPEKKSTNSCSLSALSEEGKLPSQNSRKDMNCENSVGSKNINSNIRRRGGISLDGFGSDEKRKKKKDEIQMDYPSIVHRKSKLEKNVKRMFRYATSRTLKNTFVSTTQILKPSKNKQNKSRPIQTAVSMKNLKEKSAIESTKTAISTKSAISRQTSSESTEKLYDVNRDEYLIPRITLPLFWCMTFTYELLRSKAQDILLPSSLWSVQVDLSKDVVVFLKTIADLSGSTSLSDKAIVFQGTLKPLAFIYNERVNLPIPSLASFEDLVLLLQYYNDLPLCVGTGIKSRPCSKYCYKYIDIANVGERCSQCTEERRRVLFCYARKLREKLQILEKP